MRRLLVVLALLTAPALARAQAPDSAAVRDAAEVQAAVLRLFDAMRAADTSAVRQAFHPAARLYAVDADSGSVRARSVDGFVTTVAASRGRRLDERAGAIAVQADEGLASARLRYVFYLGEQFSHCGVDDAQLVRTAEGWKILSLAFTIRRQGCDPAAAP